MASAKSLGRAFVELFEATTLPRTLRLRWVTMRNDAAWIVRDLRGEGRSPLIVRGPSRYRDTAPIPSPEGAKRPMGEISMASRPLRVERVIEETDDVVSIVLSELDGAPLAFEAGQFLTFQLELDGKPMRRAYSLSSSPLDPHAAVTVKKMGRGSELMHELRAGSIVHARGPSGSFVAPTAKEPARLVMIAGGSGITPIMSIAETVLRARPELSVSLIYGSRSLGDVIFRERLERLACDRMSVDHLLGATVDVASLAASIDRLPNDLPRVYYLCGPRAMMDAARALLEARGATDIREERFQSPTESVVELPRDPVVAEMRVGSRRHFVSVTPGQTLLEAGLAAGAALPFSCAMGGCGACKVKLVSGEVHSETSCLSERERAEGYVLTCSSKPKTRVSLEVRANNEVR